MFNVPLFLTLSACVSIACIGIAKNCAPYCLPSSEANRAISAKLLFLSLTVRTWLLAAMACFIGCHNAPLTELSAPFLEALISLKNPSSIFALQLCYALLGSAAALVGLYLLTLLLHPNPKLLTKSISSLGTTALFGSFIEEIIFRWGLMSLIARIINVEFVANLDISLLIALFLSSLTSSFYHLSDLISVRDKENEVIVLKVLISHFWKSMCYGFLFWKFGFTAAVICHIFVELVSAYINQHLISISISSFTPRHK